MIRIDIKPLSVNQAFTGRRFKTPEYKAFKTELLWLLPKLTIPEGKLKISFIFGFSNHLSDIDGAIKQSLDVICERYGFDDRIIYKLEAEKQIVPKGKDFIKFEITGTILEL